MAEPPNPPALPSELPVIPLRGAVVLPMTAFALLYRRGSSLIEIVDSLLLNETLAKVEYSFPDAMEGFDINNRYDWLLAEHLVAAGEATLPEIPQQRYG